MKYDDNANNIANNHTGITVFFELFNPNSRREPSPLYIKPGWIYTIELYAIMNMIIEHRVIFFLI